MALIETLVKRAIEIHDAFEVEKTPIDYQSKQLKKLLKKASNTAFGQYYGFKKLLQAEDVIKAYQKEVPVFEYNDMQHWWEQQQKFPNITWPGMPHYFALSSGTTGKESKRIPVTDAMSLSFLKVSISQVSCLRYFDLPEGLFGKQLLALGSSADLKVQRGHLEGEISGINASRVPEWAGIYYKPGAEIARIDNWDERLEAIVKNAPNWDIGGLAGIPSWVLMMLKAIVKEYRLSSIHEMWPSLQIYTTGGVAFEPFRKSFDALFTKPVIYMDTYLASEGYFAFNTRPQTNAMQLALHHDIFFEFIPFNEKGFDHNNKVLDNPEVLSINQVELDQDYAMLVSTPAGAYRYMIGDTVKFTDLEKSEIVITGRTKYFLNVVGSQLSEEKLNHAIQQLSEALEVTINEFAVAALEDENGVYFHQWVISTDRTVDQYKAEELLDNFLQGLNKNYRVERTLALGYIKIRQVNKEDFYNWLEKRKKKGGQIKVPKVMSAEKMRDFLAFLTLNNPLQHKI